MQAADGGIIMKRFIICLLLILQTFFAAYAGAAPAIPPRPAAGSGIYVQDNAGVISEEDKQQMLSLGAELDNKTTAQLAVLTINTLDGEPIEDYSLEVLRQWGIGSKEQNNGALIVVAVKDRRSRIEVGYGLEGSLPDGLTGRIQDQYMIPYCKDGNYSKGILQGYKAAAAKIAQGYNTELSGVKYQAPASQPQKNTGYSLDDLLFALGVIGFLIVDNLLLGGFFTRILLLLIFRGGGRGGGGRGFGGGSGGGGGAEKPAVDMRTDFIWFKVEVPEGVEVTDVAGDTADRAQFKFTESEHASDRFIPVFDPDKNADELFDYEAKWNASFEWTENDPVKYNGKTWRNASYTHSGGVTTEYFTEAGGGSVYVRIDNVEEHKDAVETMMKSLEFADDIAKAKSEAMDVKLDDIEIKR